MEGQISIFDILQEPKGDMQIMMYIGQEIFTVVRGDVLRWIVYDNKPWDCGGYDVGYRLQSKDGCGYNCTWNHSIGKDTFFEYEQAIEIAETYLNSHDVLRKEKIIAEETMAYRYVRGIDGREITTFYSKIGNGLLYVDDFMTFEHIVADSKESITDFMNQLEYYGEDIEKIDYFPQFKNMYPCNNKPWKYAESRYMSY